MNLPQPGVAGASNQRGTRASQAVGEADWIEATRLRPPATGAAFPGGPAPGAQVRAAARTIISDSKTYGTIGAIFGIMTWFIAIGAVIILGAVAGAVRADRRTSKSGNNESAMRPSTRS